MEFLGKIYLVLLIGLMSFTCVTGQDFIRKRDAFQKSYLQEATGDYHGAIESLKGVFDEKSYEINVRLGWLNYSAGNFPESKAYYNKAISLMPYAVEPRFGLAYPLAALGNWNEVIAQYEKIIEILPNNTVAMHRLGLIYYEKRDFESAKKYFEKVVNLYPFDYDGLNMLAWTYFRLNNTREAKVLFQKALLNTPNGASAIEGLDLVK